MPGEAEKETLSDRIDDFMTDLKKGKQLGSFEIVQRTTDILKRVIAHMKWTTAQELMDLVRSEGKKMLTADPSESTIGNVVRLVLKIIREEYVTSNDEIKLPPTVKLSPYKISLEIPENCDYTLFSPKLKGSVIETIEEFRQELRGCVENIAAQALEHIHADETIMTFGRSRTVEAFLKNAARKRKFHVLVTEGEPFFQGHHLAKSLAEAGISVTLIPDTHIYAMMRRVNKVIIGTHTVMAEGGLKAPCGTFNMALAAKDHKVPVFVCASSYKMSPEQFRSESQPGFQRWADPKLLFSPQDLEDMEDVEVCNFVFEYVPPRLVDLFIFNMGTSSPSNVYRVLKEMYYVDELNMEL